MPESNKKSVAGITASAGLCSAAVLLLWISEQPRFQGISPILTAAAAIAFVLEIIILLLFKGKGAVKRALKILLLSVINISVFACAVIYSYSSAIILQPHKDEESCEKLKETPFAREITFDGENGKINGWLYNRAGENAPVVLYFYGNYETASTRLSHLSEVYASSAFADCNFAVFDYPSYGNSEGKCTDDTLLSFALNVYDKLSEITDNIIVLGYSVGTGPAVYLAAERDVNALILYAPYADGTDLYNNIIDIFYGPLEKLVSFNIDSKENARAVTEPVLILASEADELIPFASSMELAEKFPGNCTFVKTAAITHNQFLSDSFVKEKTAEFIKGVTAK